jgi:hypothetical protein
MRQNTADDSQEFGGNGGREDRDKHVDVVPDQELVADWLGLTADLEDVDRDSEKPE